MCSVRGWTRREGMCSVAKMTDRQAGETIDNAVTGRRRGLGVYRVLGEGRPEREESVSHHRAPFQTARELVIRWQLGARGLQVDETDSIPACPRP